MPKFRILDTYVGLLYLRVFALTFLGLLGIFYIATFIDLSDKLFKGSATGTQLVLFLWYSSPQFIYYLLPLSALVSTLVTVGLLTKSSELIVMRACGISLYRVALPVLVLGFVWSGALFGLEESILAHVESSGGRVEAHHARRFASHVRRDEPPVDRQRGRQALSLHVFRSAA